MYQFYIVEVKKLPSGEFEHNVFWTYDEDADKAQLTGESKYHEILATAALSETQEHSVILFTSQGFPLEHKCYTHDVQPPVAEEPVDDEPVTEE